MYVISIVTHFRQFVQRVEEYFLDSVQNHDFSGGAVQTSSVFRENPKIPLQNGTNCDIMKIHVHITEQYKEDQHGE